MQFKISHNTICTLLSNTAVTDIYAYINKEIKSRDSSVGIATRLWAGQSGF
jgi:hypothetical protein